MSISWAMEHGPFKDDNDDDLPVQDCDFPVRYVSLYQTRSRTCDIALSSPDNILIYYYITILPYIYCEVPYN